MKSVTRMKRPVTVDPREEFLLYNVIDRNGMNDRFDIGFKKNDGSWTTPKPLGNAINHKSARFPAFTSKGKYFFFNSYRSGVVRIYLVNREVFNLSSPIEQTCVKGK